MRLRIKSSSRKIILSVFFFISLLLTHIPESKYSGAQMAVVSILWPLQSGAFSLSTIASHFAGDVFFSFRAGRENRELKEKANWLQNRVIQQRSTINSQRETIKALTAVREKTEPGVGLAAAQITAQVPGKIISISSANWRRLLIVDAGSTSGIEVDMPVVWRNAIVGRVIKVGFFSSAVQLVNDPDFRIWVVDMRSREEGIVRGKGAKLCEMAYVGLEADVKKDDWLLSSGFDGVFPKNFVVGRVSDTPQKSHLLFQDIDVEPAADLKKLENVIILKIHEPFLEFEDIEAER